MPIYFITANLWAAVAIAFYAGSERIGPGTYTLFDLDGYFNSFQYFCLLAAPTVLAGLCFALFLNSRPKQHD